MVITKSQLYNLLILLFAILLTAGTTALICHHSEAPNNISFCNYHDQMIMRIASAIPIAQSQHHALDKIKGTSDKLSHLAHILENRTVRSFREQIKNKLEDKFETLVDLIYKLEIHPQIQASVKEALLKYIQSRTEEMSSMIEKKVNDLLMGVDTTVFGNWKEELIKKIEILSPKLAEDLRANFGGGIFNNEFVKNLIKEIFGL
ncbi:hypothetical protein TCON_2171 [Astathelohania contejeani]|uniref:Uncharacterized protein n=1 Tax=Astathelohania contejeani TaxID=164912 RepID=A0ABQ7HWS4_9MICR|nr:hypothetical protein TCON_2171 [Thelohania contejeani]